jgi:hypothetical protein
MTTNKILSLGFGIALAAAAALPAAAATAPAHATTTAATTAKHHHTYFYVSRNPHGKGCEIVNHRPTSKLAVSKYYYATHKGAAAELKASKICRA